MRFHFDRFGGEKSQIIFDRREMFRLFRSGDLLLWLDSVVKRSVPRHRRKVA